MVLMSAKYRLGQLWNMKIAYRQQRPYFPGIGPPNRIGAPIVADQILVATFLEDA